MGFVSHSMTSLGREDFEGEALGLLFVVQFAGEEEAAAG